MEQNKLSMVVFSGDMDKLMAAFIIATGAAASGMEVTMFFTFWGLQAIKKPEKTGKSFFGKLLGFMLKDINGVGPSKMNFGGIGRWMFKKMMKAKNVAMLDQLRNMAIELGVKLVPCQMSMEVMELTQDKLIPQVSQPAGVATFLEEARNSKITLFI
ncbi:Peroxiredoxin family protein [Candidatus Kryptonium thompsonii]|jgi:peroxiredoxin family protein|nr:Peroxiredoxin family protein [Candidatus Kryptonium thompsoni]